MKKFGSELLLLLTAAIWGFAFVAQRQGMQYMDPLLFNGIRFALGAVILGIIAWKRNTLKFRIPLQGMLLGLVLFIAASFQQIGIVSTTAGNAGFITGLYVVFVPILGIYRKQKISLLQVAAVLLSVVGLYCINYQSEFEVTKGNLLVLAGAFFWAVHVHLIDIFTKKHETFSLAFVQFAVCAVLSLVLSPLYFIYTLSVLPLGSFAQTWLPILYSGILSVGVAFTLQIHAQKKVPPVPATLILCLEGVFALLGGWLLLHEKLTVTVLLGAALILAAMLLSILSPRISPKDSSR